MNSAVHVWALVEVRGTTLTPLATLKLDSLAKRKWSSIVDVIGWAWLNLSRARRLVFEHCKGRGAYMKVTYLVFTKRRGKITRKKRQHIARGAR